MKQRILTALILAPLAIAAVLWLPTAWFMALVGVVLLLGLWEWTRLAGVASRPLRATILLATAAAIVMLDWRGDRAWLEGTAVAGAVWWLAAGLWLGNVRWGRRRRRRGQVVKLAAGCLMMLSTWAALALLHGAAPNGPRVALFSVFLVWAADSFAYFTGSRIGGRKLAPSISPGKTWSGLIGGLVGAVLIAVPALPLLGLAWSALPRLMLLALVAAIASVIGDLFESLIKRHSGAKDSSNLIPGHGGVMDRLDSIVAAVPVFAVGWLWLGL